MPSAGRAQQLFRQKRGSSSGTYTLPGTSKEAHCRGEEAIASKKEDVA